MKLLTETTEAAVTTAAETIQVNPADAFSDFGSFAATVWEGFLSYLPTLIFAVVLLIVGLIVSKLVLRLMRKGIAKGKTDATVSSFLYSVVKIVLYALLISIVLTALGVPSASIIAVIGTAGVAVGLALQDSLANVAGGFIILLEKPFKIGDYIVSNGQEGTVEKISILYTTINTADNKAVFIPNSSVSTSTVVNVSRNELRRVDTEFSISYNDDYDTARQLILDVISENKAIMSTPEPFVKMTAHGDSAIVIGVRVWVKNSDYFDVKFYLIEQVRKTFIANNIEIPFNQLDVRVIK